MANPAYPLINGQRYSWASVEIKLDGQVFTGVREISYKDKVEVGDARGTGQVPLGSTAGEYKAENASLTLLKSEGDTLRAALATKAGSGKGISRPTFEIVVQYEEPGEAIITDILEGCRYVATDASHAQGPDALEDKIEVYVLRIKWNGVYLADQANAGASG